MDNKYRLDYNYGPFIQNLIIPYILQNVHNKHCPVQCVQNAGILYYHENTKQRTDYIKYITNLYSAFI